MSDERDEPGERKQAEDDAREDLELKDEDAEQVRGGLKLKEGKLELEKTKIGEMRS